MIPNQNREKIKLYLVILLALIAAVVAYFRFIHKGSSTIANNVPTPLPQSRLDSGSVNTTGYQRPQALRRSMPEPSGTDIRDIFALPQLPGKPEPSVPLKPATPSAAVETAAVAEPPAPPPLNVTLKGTVVGGKEPLAIIDDKFVRLGEKIGAYQVVMITPDAVYLKAGNHQKIIYVMSGASP